MMPRFTRPCIAACAALLAAAPAHAQDGAGSAGAAVLQMLAGGRAAGLSGAYTAATGDADVLFYNPAGIASLGAGAALSYQRHVEDIGLASGAGAFRIGRFNVGISAIFLDYGSIDVIVPDPAFGNQTGMPDPSGATASASEVAARLSAATLLLDDRLSVGASAGMVSVELAGLGRSTPMFDLGAQYALPFGTVGASLRNLGGDLSGEDLADASLPSQLRVGGAFAVHGPSGIGALVTADLVAELAEGSTGFVAGLEAGLMPRLAGDLTAVGRVGFNGAAGDDGLGTLQLGGGIALGGFAVDYAYQNYDFFGTLHRVGVRWSRLP
jgi:hypothetical protein